MEITRETTIDATPDEVWELLADDEERAAWLGDDGADRPVRIDEAIPGERLAWTWWPAHTDRDDGPDDGPASTVTITLVPLSGGGTALRVVERLVAPAPRAIASARAAWGRRLLGVELLLVLAHARV